MQSHKDTCFLPLATASATSDFPTLATLLLYGGNVYQLPVSIPSFLASEEKIVPSTKHPTMMSPKSTYLTIYNLLSLLLWTYIIITVLTSLLPFPTPSTPHDIYSTILPLLTTTQSLALLEVLHASLSLVRASPLTTALQVGGKNLVVWTVMRPFPGVTVMQSPAGRWGFLGCLVAWGLSEMVRYGFFVGVLLMGGAGAGSGSLEWLKWLRLVMLHYAHYLPSFGSPPWLVGIEF